MNFTPTNIALPQHDILRIEWNDGLVAEINIPKLRAQCPCATCREKRQAVATQPAGLLPVLDPKEAQPTRIEAMRPVGNYAYSIRFNDGHDTGIFTLEFLREISEALGKPE
jgi:DUF971 family protein